MKNYLEVSLTSTGSDVLLCFVVVTERRIFILYIKLQETFDMNRKEPFVNLKKQTISLIASKNIEKPYMFPFNVII